MDDGAQHPVVLLKPHKALKLVHFPVKAFLHLIQRGHVRVAGALHGAGAEGEGQMQKADEQQLFVLPPGEEIPADEVLCLGAKLSAKAGKHPLSLGVVGGDVLDRVQGGSFPLGCPHRKGNLVLGKALEHAAQKAFKAAVVEVHHIRIVELRAF